jgi:hypothetical protein
MISNLLKNRRIKKLQNELIAAKNIGSVVFVTNVTDITVPGGTENVIGVEIMFCDRVTDDQVSKIVSYIKDTYHFNVITELCERGNNPKILIVEY